MGATWAIEYRGARIASVKTAWRHVLKRAGIPHCTRHDLRHYSGIRLILGRSVHGYRELAPLQHVA